MQVYIGMVVYLLVSIYRSGGLPACSASASISRYGGLPACSASVSIYRSGGLPACKYI